MKLTIYKLNSFTKTENGGNPAGVVLQADSLSEKEMVGIARKVGFSETAFVQKSDKADFKVRFFTPESEVDLCGHATIATFTLLKSKGIITTGVFSQETKANILNITVGDNYIFMNQNPPLYLDIIAKADIARSLNIHQCDLSADLPAQIVTTGLRDIFIPIRSLDSLLSIQPNFEQIATICKRHNVIGFHVFSLDTKLGSHAHCRNFAPLYGINEESATGTSNGALACYLFSYGVLKKEQTSNIVFEQGYSMNRPSEILVQLKTDNDRVKEVKVGGTAIIQNEFPICPYPN